MVHRTFDPVLLNRIGNHRAVKASFCPSPVSEIDFAPVLEATDDYVVLTNGATAACIFEWSGPGVWQSHSLVIPEGRGRQAVADGKEMLRWMFVEMSARLIWGQTPKSNRAACLFNRLIGAKSAGSRDFDAAGPCELFIVERDLWLHQQ